MLKDNSLSKITAVNYLLIDYPRYVNLVYNHSNRRNTNFGITQSFVFCHNIVFNGRRDVIDYDDELNGLRINVD